MPANWVSGDDVNGIFSQVMEHQEANIVDLWTKADQKINPVLASFEERSEDDGGGRGFITRVGIGTGTSANPSFSKAQSKASGTTTGNSSINGRWVSQAQTLEVVAQWTRKAMNVARGDGPGEVYDVISRERESKLVLARHRLAVFAIEAGWGRVATVTGISTGNLYFTVDPSEVNRFRIGDDIVFAQYESTGAVAGTTPYTVAGTIPRTGQVTLEAKAAPNASDRPYDTEAVRTGWTVFWDGYRDVGSSPVKLCPNGLRAWVPMDDPTGTFDGIDRTNRWEVSGLRIDASAGTQLDHAAAFLEMSAIASQYSTELHAIFTSVRDYTILCRNKDAVKMLELGTGIGPYNISFDGAYVLGGSNGRVPIIPDVYIPQGYAWAGPWNDAEQGPKMKHTRQLLNVDNLDGNEFLRLATATGFEQRMYFEGANIIPGPGKYVACKGLPTS